MVLIAYFKGTLVCTPNVVVQIFSNLSIYVCFVRSEKMTKVIFIVSSIYFKGDGYKTRVNIEIERLKEYYEVILFVPKYSCKDNLFPKSVTVIEYPTFYESKHHYLKNNVSFFKQLNCLLKNNSRSIVIGESLIPSIKAYTIAKTNNCKFVFDCHGTEPNEFRLNNPGAKGFVLFHLLAYFEKRVVKNSDLVVTVTQAQFDSFGIKKNHVVFPMMPSEVFFSKKNQRDSIRSKLGIKKDELVFVYSGQNQKWQMCEETLDFFKKFQKSFSNARLAIFTGCVEYFQSLVKQKDIENAIVVSVPYEQMPYYLDACDFGFCIRNSSVINRFASPTKVLEYVSRNVRPILSEYVGDFSSSLTREGLGYVISKEQNFNFERINNNRGKKYVTELNIKMEKDYLNAIKNLG